MSYSFQVSTYFDEVKRSKPMLLYLFFIFLCQKVSAQFPPLFLLLCRRKVVQFTLASFAKQFGNIFLKKPQSFLCLENLLFSMFSVTVELPGHTFMADIPQIQQFLSREQLPPVFPRWADQTCEPVVLSNMREYP